MHSVNKNYLYKNGHFDSEISPYFLLKKNTPMTPPLEKINYEITFKGNYLDYGKNIILPYFVQATRVKGLHLPIFKCDLSEMKARNDSFTDPTIANMCVEMVIKANNCAYLFHLGMGGTDLQELGNLIESLMETEKHPSIDAIYLAGSALFLADIKEILRTKFSENIIFELGTKDRMGRISKRITIFYDGLMLSEEYGLTSKSFLEIKFGITE